MALAMIIVFSRYVKRVPGYIVALFPARALVVFLKLPVETIGTRFGGIPSGLPALRIPHFRVDLLRPLISPAITVAMLGAIESLMTAVVSDRMSGGQAQSQRRAHRAGRREHLLAALWRLAGDGRHRPNRDQYPLGSQDTGSRHGTCFYLARHRPLGRPAGQIHPSVGAGRDPVRGLLQDGRVARDTGATAAFPPGNRHLADHLCLTVFADLTVAVEVGMILAAFVFIRKVTATTTVSQVTDEYFGGHAHILQHKEIPPM